MCNSLIILFTKSSSSGTSNITLRCRYVFSEKPAVSPNLSKVDIEQGRRSESEDEGTSESEVRRSEDEDLDESEQDYSFSLGAALATKFHIQLFVIYFTC